MDFSREELAFASQRMQYYTKVIGLNQEMASVVVNEELRERVINELKNKDINTPSNIAKFIEQMHRESQLEQVQTKNS